MATIVTRLDIIPERPDSAQFAADPLPLVAPDRQHPQDAINRPFGPDRQESQPDQRAARFNGQRLAEHGSDVVRDRDEAGSLKLYANSHFATFQPSKGQGLDGTSPIDVKVEADTLDRPAASQGRQSLSMSDGQTLPQHLASGKPPARFGQDDERHRPGHAADTASLRSAAWP